MSCIKKNWVLKQQFVFDVNLIYINEFVQVQRVFRNNFPSSVQNEDYIVNDDN